MTSPFPIDAVIPWVDGSDPVLSARRASFATGRETANDESGGPTRYQQIGELRYSVASILRYAPWIRKVFIVTDGQDPALGPMLEKHFPERVGDVVTVDHKVIFRGREEYLPVFNSNSIDTLIWNIPDLAEHFIYFNDDLMLMSPVQPEDFFRDGKVVSYGSWCPAWFVRLLRALKPRHIGFKASMLRALEMMGGGSRFVLMVHTPHPLLKSWYAKWTEERPDMVENNLRYKFRNVLQFEAQEPFYLGMAAEGRLILEKEGDAVRYFKRRSKAGYVDSKIAAFDADTTGKFVCFNSLNYCTPEEQEKVLLYLERMTGMGGQPMERREIQMRLLDILRDVDAFCREKGLRYSMAYGTLLGAVRHKGFIPWDDDIDLLMPRPDFERFVREYGRRGPYEVLYGTDTPEAAFVNFFAKVHDTRTRSIEPRMPAYHFGINIDIFPVDGKPDDMELNLRRERRFCSDVHHLYMRQRPLWPLNFHDPLLGHIASYKLTPQQWFERMTSEMKSIPFEGSRLCGSMSVRYVGNAEIFPRELFENYVELPFEGGSFMAFRDWDAFLRQQFGDYMQLPPENKRKTHSLLAFALPEK